MGFIAYGTATGGPGSPSFVQRYQKLDIFASVLSYIENDYVEPIQSKKLIHGAVRGMIKQLDPYTVFIPPRQYQEMKADTSGEHGGPGLELRQKGSAIVIRSPLPGSPALRAGLRKGDLLLKANAQNLAGRSLFDVRRILRGRPGARLTLFFRRKAETRVRKAVLIREQIRIRSVQMKMVSNRIAHIRIKSFQDRTGRQLKAALLALKKKGSIRGLVLDLRGNPGGLFDQAVRVVDLFIKRGVIVTARGRDPKKIEREYAHPKGTFLGFPIVCLINRGSASAAEIVAGALQDHRRAVLMGTLSFGKGSVQTIIDLADGSGLKMTIARYYTPLNRLIHGTGIQPDVLISPSVVGRGDRQLSTAIRYLSNTSLYRRSLGRSLPASLKKKRP